VNEFERDGWTMEQWAFCMRAAYTEQRNRGVPHPRISYQEALEWHRTHHRLGALMVDAT